MVQWLRFYASNRGGLGLIPGQGSRSHMLQLRIRMSQLKIMHPMQDATLRQWRNKHREQTCGHRWKEEGEGEMYEESDIVKHIANGNSLYDSGNSKRGSVKG